MSANTTPSRGATAGHTPGPKEREMIEAGIRGPYHCTRCNELLNPERLVWLELDTRTGTYTDDAVEPEHSQGGFMFGAACARRECEKHRLATKGERDRG